MTGEAKKALELDEEKALDNECASCGEGDPENECGQSRRPCGHHCNHIWTHDSCHWCGIEEDAPDALD